MRTELDVPFSHKEEAKALGAKWDRTKKIWYVPSGVKVTHNFFRKLTTA